MRYAPSRCPSVSTLMPYCSLPPPTGRGQAHSVNLSRRLGYEQRPCNRVASFRTRCPLTFRSIPMALVLPGSDASMLAFTFRL